MRYPQYRTAFKKDVKRLKRRRKDLQKLARVSAFLIRGEPLPPTYKDHALIGNYVNHRECHIEPDWLLIYRLDGDHILFERTGCHSDLFSKY